jgi:hypothetical protein
VAALIVPLHSIFDVPGHRPSLLLASVFLFALSRNPAPRTSEPCGKLRSWPFLAIGLLVLTAGIRLLGTTWFGFAQPQLALSDQKVAEGASIYREIVSPAKTPDLFKSLEQRKDLWDFANTAAKNHPLESRLHRIKALALLPISSENQNTLRNFEIDRALSPHSVGLPLIQANALIPYQRDSSSILWGDALKRARKLQATDPETQYTDQWVLKSALRFLKGNSDLRSFANDYFKNESSGR